MLRKVDQYCYTLSLLWRPNICYNLYCIWFQIFLQTRSYVILSKRTLIQMEKCYLPFLIYFYWLGKRFCPWLEGLSLCKHPDSYFVICQRTTGDVYIWRSELCLNNKAWAVLAFNLFYLTRSLIGSISDEIFSLTNQQVVFHFIKSDDCLLSLENVCMKWTICQENTNFKVLPKWW